MSVDAMQFERGRAYVATATHGGEQMVVAVTGKRNGWVTFSRVNLLKRVAIREIEGRDTAIIRTAAGLDYFVSAACEVDLQNAAEVYRILKRGLEQ